MENSEHIRKDPDRNRNEPLEPIFDEDALPPRLFDCPSCGKKLQVPPELMGKQVHCANCAESFLAEGFFAGKPKRLRPDTKAHRGRLILILGIVSIVLTIP